MTRFSFEPSDAVPLLSLTCAFTFPRVSDRYVLIQEAERGWNPIGGHLEVGEVWQTALQREAVEEAGLVIDDVQVKGYLRGEVVEGASPYPRESAILVTTCSVTEVLGSWPEQGEITRGEFTYAEALEALGRRADSNQYREIFRYVFAEGGVG